MTECEAVVQLISNNLEACLQDGLDLLSPSAILIVKRSLREDLESNDDEYGSFDQAKLLEQAEHALLGHLLAYEKELK